jgi:hypothetical protein
MITGKSILSKPICTRHSRKVKRSANDDRGKRKNVVESDTLVLMKTKEPLLGGEGVG